MLEAAVFVDREISHGLQEAESWTKGYIPDHRIRTLGISALCAGLVSHGWQEVCILAGIAVVVRQRSACAPHEHHRYTRCCLDPCRPSRSGIDDLTGDCSKARPSLLAAVAHVAALPMGDSIVEFPHAMASRLVKFGRATKFPFMASSAVEADLDYSS